MLMTGQFWMGIDILAASRDLLEHLVTVDPAVVTNDPSGRIGEGDAGIRAMTRLERHTERHQRTRDQRHKSRITEQVRKLGAGVLAQGQQVKCSGSR